MMLRTLETLLVSNGIALDMSSQRLGWLEATNPSQSMEQMRLFYQQNGYLWLKGLLSREFVLNFRRWYFSAFQQTQLLKAGSDPVDGIYSGHNEPQIEIHKIAMEVIRSPEYEEFSRAEAMVHFLEAFLSGEVHLHKRKIIRSTLPGDPHCTGAHYDLTYLRAGADTFCTIWMPIGDIPVEMGGLVYLEGSDALGRTLEAQFSRQNANLSPEERISAYNKNMKSDWLSKNLPELAEKSQGRWLIADYEAGDIVIHSPYMIHAATVNNDPAGRMRLSSDIRYQLASDKLDHRWNNHYYPGDNL